MAKAQTNTKNTKEDESYKTAGKFFAEMVEEMVEAQKLLEDGGRVHGDVIMDTDGERRGFEALEDYQLQHIADGDTHQLIDENALSLEYEGRWAAGETPAASRAFLLTCTGGPAARVVIDFDDQRAWTECQDWFKPWIKTGEFSSGAYGLLAQFAEPQE